MWQDQVYLARKELRTVRDDKRDIMPDCVIRVTLFTTIPSIKLLLQEIRRRYPSKDGQYRDYMSTFDASIMIM